ncbi:Clp protease regulatory subunit ClpX1, mitochondrial, partial [Tanacetum coccineum]
KVVVVCLPWPWMPNGDIGGGRVRLDVGSGEKRGGGRKIKETFKERGCDTILKIVNVSEKGERKRHRGDNIQMVTKDILFICGGAFIDLEKTISERAGGVTTAAVTSSLLEIESSLHFDVYAQRPEVWYALRLEVWYALRPEGFGQRPWV